ncbi:hypothetical protein AC1031_002992 [Aphanomyces cochlioides]|nr:hypothetical protein AC1031_002992 [Aphanomyces cochlioides]
MVKKKTKSKRLTLHKKYKILRKVREHKRKERKKERLGAGKKKKTPGIPNNWPFKEELLLQEEQARLAEKEHQAKLKEQRRLEKAEKKKQDKLVIDSLAQVPTLTPLSIKEQAKAELKAAIVKSDLVVVVLDARDPQGSRSLSLEDGLIAHGKKDVLLVLNKVDLISVDAAEKWVTYLRRFHPTVAVRAANKTVKDVTRKTKSVSSVTSAALQARVQELETLRDNGCVDTLAQVLEDYAKAKGGAKSTVAFVGYPNVGKSTLFNSLKRKMLSPVSSKPRSTRTNVEAQLGQFIAIVDTPALPIELIDPSSVLVKYGLAEEYTMEPVEAVDSVLSRGDMWSVMQVTAVPTYKSNEDFLKKYAAKKQLVRKGGEPDVLLGARAFLKALTDGSLPTSTQAPTQSKSRFDLPTWFKSDEKLEQALYSTNPNNSAKHSSYLTFKCQGSSHRPGETTEYDFVMGNLKLEDIQMEDDEEEEDEEDDDEEEEDEEEEDEEEEEEEEEEEDEVVEVPPPKKGSKKAAAPTKKPAAPAKKPAAPAKKAAAPAKKETKKAEAPAKETKKAEAPAKKEIKKAEAPSKKAEAPAKKETKKAETKKESKKVEAAAKKTETAAKKAEPATKKSAAAAKKAAAEKEPVVEKATKAKEDKKAAQKKDDAVSASRKRKVITIEEPTRTNPKRATRSASK